MHYRKVFIVLLAVLSLFSLSFLGCTEVPSSITITQGVAANPVTVYGKVIDQQTRQGVVSALVRVKVNGVWRAVYTSAGTGTAPYSTAGDFTLAGLPVNGAFPMVISSPATGTTYATVVTALMTDDYSDWSMGVNSQISQDIGQIEMEQGVTLNIRVVDADTGAAVTTASGSVPIYVDVFRYFKTSFNFAPSILDMLVTQDATDTSLYTVVIPQSQVYNTFTSTYDPYYITIPALDTDGDGIYDYQTATKPIGNGTTDLTSVEGDLTTVIALSPVGNDTQLSVVADNMITYGTDEGDGLGTDATQMTFISGTSIVYIFNMPISLDATAGDTNLTLSFTDDMKTLTDTVDPEEVGITTTLSMGNCMLTIAPTASTGVFLEGETYRLAGSVRSTADIDTDPDQVYEIENISGLEESIAVKLSTVTLADMATTTGLITVDNFNYYTGVSPIVTGETAPQAAAQAYLVFPEPVWGTVRLISRTLGAGPTTTIVNGDPIDITGQSIIWTAEVLSTDGYNAVMGANREGFVSVFNLTDVGIGVVADHTGASAVQYTLGLDIYNCDGVSYIAEETFSVQ